jgi:hypothetical protein
MRVVVPTLPVAPAGAWRQGPSSRGGVPPAKAAEQYVPPWVANYLLSVARAAGALVARCVCSWGNQPPTLFGWNCNPLPLALLPRRCGLTLSPL